ncbi:unnamed protein product [Fraxinus pennsylvanica]|uniref:BHLH domain-containing protein n=1 Tax=Fraxinus pennsylvanica TaxID=56036 RepID=A0AAD2E815_9LAMI|nr:unnamed protein product [Fraxinus pennsylvanica]
MLPCSRDMQAMNINSFLNQLQQPQMSLPELEIHHHQNGLSSHFDPASSHDDFLDHILSSAPSSFHWDLSSPSPSTTGDPSLPSNLTNHFNDQSAKALMLSRGPPNLENDASVQALYDGFTGFLGQTSDQTQHFHHPQDHNSGAPAAEAAPPSTASGSGGGGAAGQRRQRVRARRGQATDPHSIAERLRRERIAERMKGLQELVPNSNKTDKASMLDEIIDYVKFLQLQVKVLSISRLGGATGIPQSHLVHGTPSNQGRSGNGKQTTPLTNNNITGADHHVTKLLEEDMGSAMQYLQGKGLCLMPISLATAISTATCRSRNPMDSINSNTNNQLVNGDESCGTSSPRMSIGFDRSVNHDCNISKKESREQE